VPSAIEALASSFELMPRRCAVHTTFYRADFETESHRHGVERHRQRLRQRHRAEIVAGVVLRPPALDVDRCVLPDRLGRQSGLDRGQVDERLERRAGLTPRGDRAIELAVGVVAAADQGAHFAARRHRHQRALGDVELDALGGEFVDHGGFRHAIAAWDRSRFRPRCFWSIWPIRSSSTSPIQSAT